MLWGVSCVAFEEQFVAILTFIEAGRLQKVSGSISKLGSKGNRELKGLECSINYDSKFETCSCAIGKERGSLVF
jgi:hypothetical protein